MSKKLVDGKISTRTLEKVGGARDTGFGTQHSFKQKREMFAEPEDSKPPAPPTVEDHAAPAHDQLFRKEVVQNASDGAFGRPISHLPFSWVWVTGALIILIVIGGVTLSLQTFERTAVVQGILQAEGGEAQVSLNQSGTIGAIEVSEGELVAAGQPLLTVINEVTTPEGRPLAQDLMAGLDEQEAILLRRSNVVDSQSFQKEMEMRAVESELQLALATARTNLSAMEERLRMAQEDVEIAEPIASRGFVSRNSMRQRELALLTAKQGVSEAEGRIQSLQAQLKRQQAISAAVPLSRSQQQYGLEEKLASLSQRRTELRSGTGRQIMAPISGRISALQANIGQTVRPLIPLMSIVPEDAPMVAVLYVPSRDIGFVRPGQMVRIRYQAFPYQRFGAAEAEVQHVSQTVIRPDQVEGSVVINEPAYRVTAKLKKQDIDAYGEKHLLFPGMALAADIVLENRSFFDWITAPLQAQGS